MNTGIANAQDPVLMAEAMKHGVMAGRQAYMAGRMQRKLMLPLVLRSKEWSARAGIYHRGLELERELSGNVRPTRGPNSRSRSRATDKSVRPTHEAAKEKGGRSRPLEINKLP